jgi:GNAT superfamily N-acetyltransferase
MTNFSIRPATEQDVPLILSFIRQLAEYERISQGVDVTEAMLRENLFGRRPYAEVLIGDANGEPVAFAVFFHNFSTFRGRPGLYLEDLFVVPQMRGKGFGRAMLVELGRIATKRKCARIEWAVLDWNQPAIEFYKTLGAMPMDEWTIFRITDQALERLANT